MTALDLGDVAAFPFVEPPDRRSVHDGVALLQELGAFDGEPPAPAHRARPPAGPAADRPAAGPDGARGRAQRLRARGPRHRRRTVHSGPARAAAGAPAGRRPEARPVPRPRLRLHRPCSTCGGTCRSSSGRCRPTSSAGCAAPSSSTTCGYGSGRTWRASCARSSRAWTSRCRRGAAGDRRVAGAPVAAGRAALPHRAAGPGEAGVLWAPAGPGSRSSPARPCSARRRAG